MRPFSDNIVFFDTEFSDLNARTGELLSVGLVKYTGEELYVELLHERPVHPWVKKNVLPTLTGDAVDRMTAVRAIEKFIGTDHPYLVSYVNQFDAIFWYDLFGSPKSHPAFWIPIDFASILFACGYDPNSMGKKNFFSELGVTTESYALHNALDDARLLSLVYKRFMAIQKRY